MNIRNRTQNKIQQAKRYDQIQQLFYIKYMKLKRTYNGYEGFLYFLLPSETYKDSIYRAKSLKIIYNIHFRRKQGPKSWIYKWQKKIGAWLEMCLLPGRGLSWHVRIRCTFVKSRGPSYQVLELNNKYPTMQGTCRLSQICF